MTVKRYAYDFFDGLNADKDGHLVAYADYAALAEQVRLLTEQRDAVVAEMAELKAFGDKLSAMHNDLNGEGTGIQGRAEVACQQIALEAAMEEFDTIKSPASDAAIAALRAEVRSNFIDDAVAAISESGALTVGDCIVAVCQLRESKGEAL